MGVIVRAGTVEWRHAADGAPVPDGWIAFDGIPPLDAVWDAGANTLRLPTAAERLLAAKAAAIAANRAEARSRILARWPLEQQSSANMGVYPQAVVDEMRSDIAAVIAAENAAADLIDAATTVAEVEAVTVNWPVI